MVGVSGELPLAEQVARYLEDHPDATVAQIAGALDANPAAITEICTRDDTESKNINKGVRNCHCGSGPQKPRPIRDPWHGLADARFSSPQSLWPSELLERRQWMGHVDKKPFAPWSDRDHPDASGDEDARWK